MPQRLDDRRQLLEEVSDATDERHQEQERDHEHPDGGAEHRDGRGEPARPAGLAHHSAHGILEHERQEDPDEHDEEGLADRPERGEHAGRRRDQQHGPHREDKFHAPRRGGLDVDWSLFCAHVCRLHSFQPECCTIRAAQPPPFMPMA